MAESEDRTQAPTKLRQQQAQGARLWSLTAQSLPGAVALLAGSLILGVCGEGLAS